MPTVEDFQAFVEQATPLLRRDAPVRAFLDFVQNAETVILADATADADGLTRAAAILQKCCGEHDLFAEAGLTGREDPTTELVRWLLAPSSHPESALARQHAWLESIAWQGSLPTAPVLPETQWGTLEGPIVDLVLPYPERVVVVEAKTGTDEHEAGATGKLQTDFYAEAVARQLPRTVPPMVVYLTLDGRDASGSAIPATYATVACAVARALGPSWDTMHVATREAFRVVMVHLLRHGGPADLTRAQAVVAKLATTARTWTPDELRTLVAALPYLSLVTNGGELRA